MQSRNLEMILGLLGSIEPSNQIVLHNRSPSVYLSKQTPEQCTVTPPTFASKPHRPYSVTYPVETVVLSIFGYVGF